MHEDMQTVWSEGVEGLNKCAGRCQQSGTNLEKRSWENTLKDG